MTNTINQKSPDRSPGEFINRAISPAVALETTLLIHGLPADQANTVHSRLTSEITRQGAHPALVGLVRGVPTVGMTDEELRHLLAQKSVPKVNTSNLGHAIYTRASGATTVSTTMELAEKAGVRVFATGGIGGVHAGYNQHLDISADLFALTRHRVAVVASGCKNILDIAATRELLETLGVPVVGYQTTEFPAFYQRDSGLPVDARFDDPNELADFLAFELARSGRGVLVANPIPQEAEIPHAQWDEWLSKARSLPSVTQSAGRDATPALLAEVHRLSDGQTIDANIELICSNARLAGILAAALHAIKNQAHT